MGSITTSTCESPYNAMIVSAIMAASNAKSLEVLATFAATGCDDVPADRLVLAHSIAAQYDVLCVPKGNESHRLPVRQAVKTLIDGLDNVDYGDLAKKLDLKNGAALVALSSLKPAKSIGDAMATALRAAGDIDTADCIASIVTHVAGEEQLPQAVFDALWSATKRHGRLTKPVLLAAIAVAQNEQRVLDAFSLTNDVFEQITGSPARLVAEAAE